MKLFTVLTTILLLSAIGCENNTLRQTYVPHDGAPPIDSTTGDNTARDGSAEVTEVAPPKPLGTSFRSVSQIVKMTTNDLPAKILFIVDNSASTAQYQSTFAKALPVLVAGLSKRPNTKYYALSTTELRSQDKSLPVIDLGKPGEVVGGIRTSNTSGEGAFISAIDRKVVADFGGSLLPWTPSFLDSKAFSDIQVTDTYRLKDSFIGSSDDPGIAAKLLNSIQIGSTGSQTEQPLCPLFRSFIDEDPNHIFNPGDNAVIVLLMNGDDSHLVGDSCLKSFRTTLNELSKKPFNVKTYYTSGRAEVLRRKDQFSALTPGTYVAHAYDDCGGNTPNPLCNPLNASTVLNTYIAPTFNQRVDFINWFNQTYQKDIQDGLVVLKPETIQMRNLFGVTTPYLSLEKPWNCERPVVVEGTTYPNVVSYYRAKNSNKLIQDGSCTVYGNGSYGISKTEKEFLPGMTQTTTSDQFADLIIEMADRKLGRSNYSISAITNSRDLDTTCTKTPEENATNLINLVRRSPTPDNVVSICDNNYVGVANKVYDYVTERAVRKYPIVLGAKEGVSAVTIKSSIRPDKVLLPNEYQFKNGSVEILDSVLLFANDTVEIKILIGP